MFVNPSSADAHTPLARLASRRTLGDRIARGGRALALVAAILPPLLIGGLKFTQVEVEALRPLIAGTPWLAWMYPAFGEAGATRLLGAVEIATALLLAASPWSARAGVLGGLLAAATFAVTSSLLLALPVWDERLGGFPALNGAGQFLIKDLALLGIALTILGQALDRSRRQDEAMARGPSR